MRGAGAAEVIHPPPEPKPKGLRRWCAAWLALHEIQRLAFVLVLLALALPLLEIVCEAVLAMISG